MQTLIPDLVPVTLVVPLSLILHATTHLLAPLYGPELVTAYHPQAYIGFLAVPAFALSYVAPLVTVRQSLCARVCLIIMAISGDVTVVFGRKVGYAAANIFGPEFGAVAARVLLGVIAVSGASSFALLCFVSSRSPSSSLVAEMKDHILPIPPPSTGRTWSAWEKATVVLNVSGRIAGYLLHVFYAEKAWSAVFGTGGASIFEKHPEKIVSRDVDASSVSTRTEERSSPYPPYSPSCLSSSSGMSHPPAPAQLSPNGLGVFFPQTLQIRWNDYQHRPASRYLRSFFCCVSPCSSSRFANKSSYDL